MTTELFNTGVTFQGGTIAVEEMLLNLRCQVAIDLVSALETVMGNNREVTAMTAQCNYPGAAITVEVTRR